MAEKNDNTVKRYKNAAKMKYTLLVFSDDMQKLIELEKEEITNVPAQINIAIKQYLKSKNK